ncbi:MAG: mechanosensitive ion channel family protein, partial [Nitriliruptoraceae bacterium]
VASTSITAQDLIGDAQRPMTEWLAEQTDSTLLLWASDRLVEPLLRIVTVVVIAWIALTLIRRAIRRAVDRAQEPQADPTRRLRQRVGLLEESPRTYSLRRAQRAQSLGALASSVVGFVVWILALFMILGTFGLNLGPLVAGAGVLGVALGFGAQYLVRDFISGVAMLLEDQYGVGDIIDAGDASGVVEGITLRTTKVRDVSGTLWHIPNGEIRRIGNMSQEWARALLDVGVAYGADIDRASEIILGVATQMAEEEPFAADVLETPEIWGVQALRDSSVDIRLVVKVTPGRQWAVARELRRRIKIAFDAAHVEIPFPQQTVWLRTEAPVALGNADTDVFDAPVPDDQAVSHAVARSGGLTDSPSVDPSEQPPTPE